MRCVIGVDAGGTSTRALLADESGRRHGFGRSGAGNPTSAGLDTASAHLTEAVLSAWMGRDESDLALPARVVITAAGVASPELVRVVTGSLASAGLEIPVEIMGDVLGAWYSATAEADGAVLIVGTGTTAARIADGQVARTADGLGWLLGDAGSGFWVGREVARAVAADLDGHGPHTALSATALAEIGESALAAARRALPSGDVRRTMPWRSPELIDFVAWVYQQRPVRVADFAPLAFAAAAAGDVVAGDIVEAATSLVMHRAAQVVDDSDGAPLVLTGGLVGPGSPLAAALATRWPGRCHRAVDGSAGAAMLALRRLGVPADGEVLARIQRPQANEDKRGA